jgi:3-oxoacyl-[acyl-carrier protein] reductase
MMELGIKGKNALVTGASKGIGRAIAIALAEAGANLCLISRNRNDLENFGREIEGEYGVKVLTIPGDVADISLAPKAVKLVLEKWQSLDILVNNSGGPPVGTVMDLSDSAWTGALEQNFLSAVRFCKEALPGMKKKNWGRIISVSSVLTKEPAAALLLSGCARSALASFVKATAVEFAASNITINIIAPGSVETDRSRTLLTGVAKKEGISYEEVLANSSKTIPIRRFADPKEIGDVAAFLASTRASYITGTSLVVDGGISKGIY